MSLANIITRNSTKTRVAITNIALAFSLSLLIKGVKNAANKGMAITSIGEWITRACNSLSFHLPGLFRIYVSTMAVNKHYH